MNKAELLAKISEDTGLPVTKMREVYASLVDTIHEAMLRDEDVRLRGFVTFHSSVRAARVDYPKVSKGERIDTPAKHCMHARISKEFNELMNEKKIKIRPALR